MDVDRLKNQKQYSLDDNQLTLRIKRPVALLRVLSFGFTALVFIGPVTGVILSVASGVEFHLIHVVSILFAGFVGYFGLRFSLWNSFGKEVYTFSDQKITRQTDYRLFQDQKNFDTTNFIEISDQPIGYIEDKKGLVVISTGSEDIVSAVRLPLQEIEEIKKALSHSNLL